MNDQGLMSNDHWKTNAFLAAPPCQLTTDPYLPNIDISWALIETTAKTP